MHFRDNYDQRLFHQYLVVVVVTVLSLLLSIVDATCLLKIKGSTNKKSMINNWWNRTSLYSVVKIREENQYFTMETKSYYISTKYHSMVGKFMFILISLKPYSFIKLYHKLSFYSILKGSIRKYKGKGKLMPIFIHKKLFEINGINISDRFYIF